MAFTRLVACLAIVVALQDSMATCKAAPIDVGTEKQLFIDNRFVDDASGCKIVVNRPRQTREKLIVQDKPWEDNSIGGYTSVIQANGLIHMWYEVRDRKRFKGVAYAYSANGGDSWVKPNLGVVEHQGSKANNIVMKDVEGTHVFYNRPQASNDERFVMFSGMPNKAFASADGIHWTSYKSTPFLNIDAATRMPGAFRHGLDSQNVIFWDTRLSKYVAFPRLCFNELPKGWTPHPVVRKYGRMEGSTLADLSGLRVVFGPDSSDPVDVDPYTTAIIQYPYAADAYFMFPAMYCHFASPPHPYNDGRIDIRFGFSRDGITWKRPDREPIVRLGIDGDWDSESLYAGYGVSRKKDELSLYYTGLSKTHGSFVDEANFGGVITRAIYRLDGFMSIDAGIESGIFTTPLVVHGGDRLELNFDGSADGQASVEILDEHGLPVPGFTAQDADPVFGNGVAKRVTWKGKSDLSSLKDRPIRLRIVMRDSKLYAFQFPKN